MLLLIVKPRLLLGLVPFAITITMVAALIAMRRIQRVEPGSVFQ
jgi:hypothetical protein